MARSIRQFEQLRPNSACKKTGGRVGFFSLSRLSPFSLVLSFSLFFSRRRRRRSRSTYSLSRCFHSLLRLAASFFCPKNRDGWRPKYTRVLQQLTRTFSAKKWKLRTDSFQIEFISHSVELSKAACPEQKSLLAIISSDAWNPWASMLFLDFLGITIW